MKTSEQINELAAALAKAQAHMAGAVKDSTNPHFRSSYADLASVWEACRKALTDAGLSVVQMTEPSEKDEVIVDTRILHSSGQWIEGRLSIPVSKADAQGYGSALTYTRRYGLAAAVGVAPADDDGNAATAAKPIPVEPPTEQEINDALALLAEEAAEGFGAVQKTMDQLRAPVQSYLRKNKRAELANIKTTATKNAETASAAH